jgi:hypothetical protein
MNLKMTVIAAGLALGFAGAAQAQSTTTPGANAARGGDQPRAERSQKNADMDRVKADYKSDMAKCKTMQGNQKDVCQADAKGKEKVARAEIEQKYDPSPRHARNVDEAKAEHEYKVAKEKCDAQKGKEESACEKEAKASYDRAKADIKSKHAADTNRAGSGGTARTSPSTSPSTSTSSKR